MKIINMGVIMNLSDVALATQTAQKIRLLKKA